MTFFDTNVMLDILADDARWADWSSGAIQDARPPRRVSPTVYAELAGRFRRADDLDRELEALRLSVDAPTREALFQAGRAHAAYRRRGGTRDRVLPDFLIGAHALDRRAALVTRDPRRYRTAFPDLPLVSPDP